MLPSYTSVCGGYQLEPAHGVAIYCVHGGKIKRQDCCKLTEPGMQRPLSSFPLSTGHQAKLISAGFESAEDLRDLSIVELSKGIKVIP